jgi:hypothetical protein
MAHTWPGGFTLQFYAPEEFDHPDLMDSGFLQELDKLRMRCGFPLKITDDARDQEDLERIYASEIAKGKDYPRNSAHLALDGAKARAVDIKPSTPRPGDGSDLTLDERELELTYQIMRMWKEGVWPKLGLGIETAHFHIDDTPRLGAKRPAFWVAVSR